MIMININASMINANSATLNGGGIYNSATLTITNGSTVGCAGAGNSAHICGGGVYNSGEGSVTIDGSTVSANTADSSGGGISNSGTFVIQNGSSIGGAGAGNLAPAGGGIYNIGGTMTVDGSTVSANSATGGFGGGIYNTNEGEANIIGSRLLSNTASNNGDATYNYNSDITVTSSCIVGNGDIAIYAGYPGATTATGNWWGSADGPGPVGTGHGDTVSENVDYGGYLHATILGCRTTTWLIYLPEILRGG